MHRRAIIFFLFFVLAISYNTSAQEADTVKTEKKSKSIYKEARKASILSAIIPGAGQIYNKKYWKAPIVYAGLGGFGYLFVTNQIYFKEYSTYLKAEYDNDVNTINDSGYSGDQLQVLKAQYRKRRDLGIIGCAVIYALNILDANVDAHLRTFDVSDDLSLQIKPYNNIYCFNNTYGFQTGLTLNLNFH